MMMRSIFSKQFLKSTRHFASGLVEYRLGAFLVLCLILGGTSQNIVGIKLPIYIVSLLMIGWALSRPRRHDFGRLLHVPAILLVAYILLTLLFLIPLPPKIWTQFPGRDIVIQGYEVSGITPLPWLALSLTPEKTFFSLFDFLPVIAIGLTTLFAASEREWRNSIHACLIIAVLSVVLGVLQLASGVQSFYLYDITNEGYAIGFFSNANHQASFLTMVLPIAVFCGLSKRPDTSPGLTPPEFRRVLYMIATIIIILGILLAGSLAGYVLLLLVIPLTILCRRTHRKTIKYVFGIMTAFVTCLALDFVLFGGYSGEFLSEFTSKSEMSRSVMFQETLGLIERFGTLGTGPGSFFDMYLIQENRELMVRVFAPQAHNDYIQTLLEYGLVGVIIVIVFIAMFVWRTITHILSSGRRDRVPLVFAVGAMCPMLHSVADYPLRTIAISAVFTLLILGSPMLKSRPVSF